MKLDGSLSISHISSNSPSALSHPKTAQILSPLIHTRRLLFLDIRIQTLFRLQVIALASLLALATAAVAEDQQTLTGPTTDGWKPDQGAHDATDRPEGVASFGGIGSVVRIPNGLKWYNPSLTAGGKPYADPRFYFCFRGIKEKFPPITKWMGFNDMFKLNQRTTLVRFDTGPEQGAIYDAIVQVSREAKVDARLILAVIMQESSGNVRVKCTNNGVQNCGLMQAYKGSVSYDPKRMKESILQMVRDGTQGTKFGPGYVQWIDQDASTRYAGDTQGNVYQAARGYNSGSINFGDLSDPRGATDSYVSDLANRLQGWNGASCGNKYWLDCNWREKSHC